MKRTTPSLNQLSNAGRVSFAETFWGTGSGPGRTTLVMEGGYDWPGELLQWSPPARLAACGALGKALGSPAGPWFPTLRKHNLETGRWADGPRKLPSVGAAAQSQAADLWFRLEDVFIIYPFPLERAYFNIICVFNINRPNFLEGKKTLAET